MNSDEHQKEQEEEQQFVAQNTSFAAEVWRTLSRIDVNHMTELKGKLTYLSWASAWSVLMELYPESYYETLDNEYFQDGTMSVSMQITIKKGACSLTRPMWLQVLNFKNQPVEHPDSHLINNTRMRCLTKAIAMCGLGCYIYQGHDLPTSDPVEVEPRLPRVPHDEHLENSIKFIEKAESYEKARLLGMPVYQYFKEWNQPDHAEKIKILMESLKEKFDSEATK